MSIEWDWLWRLLSATAVGLVIGLNRDLTGKPIGMRTLSLVSLGAAVVCLATINYRDLAAHPDALSRVVQGIIQGILTGVGFIGAGVILRDRQTHTVHGLTTAATVWVTAALGIACALAAWRIVLGGVVIAVLVLFLLQRIEAWIFRDKT
jgi:putative Mg2+ transporter-C (MgtC) family protein